MRKLFMKRSPRQKTKNVLVQYEIQNTKSYFREMAGKICLLWPNLCATASWIWLKLCGQLRTDDDVDCAVVLSAKTLRAGRGKKTNQVCRHRCQVRNFFCGAWRLTFQEISIKSHGIILLSRQCCLITGSEVQDWIEKRSKCRDQRLRADCAQRYERSRERTPRSRRTKSRKLNDGSLVSSEKISQNCIWISKLQLTAKWNANVHDWIWIWSGDTVCEPYSVRNELNFWPFLSSIGVDEAEIWPS